jgi:hypothetical protein
MAGQRVHIHRKRTRFQIGNVEQFVQLGRPTAGAFGRWLTQALCFMEAKNGI